jgi:hypothetical protein
MKRSPNYTYMDTNDGVYAFSRRPNTFIFKVAPDGEHHVVYSVPLEVERAIKEARQERA